MPLLEAKGLTVEIGAARVVDGLGFSLEPGKVFGLLGESGCGKSMTALAMMGLLPRVARASGSLSFDSRELLGQGSEAWRLTRGREIAMVFQEPFTSLNPVMRVQDQLVEALLLDGLAPEPALAKAWQWLERVGIPQPKERGRQYPHQWSGGMRQRAMIAMALCRGPKVLIADEPTTALDVTVQAQVLDLLKELLQETRVALLLISHDLGVIHQMSDQVAVMRQGRLIESGSKSQIFGSPGQAYTRELLTTYLHWAGVA